MAGSQNVVVIGDHDLAHELLEVRSANTWSRLKLPYMRDYIDPEGSIWSFSSDKHTVHLARRLSARSMSAVRNGRTERLAQYETLLLMHQLLDAPSAWMKHIERVSISQGFTLAFGLSLPTGEEPGFHLARKTLNELVSECRPTASIINFMPIWDRLPAVPKPWRRRAANHRRTLSDLFQEIRTHDQSSQAASAQTWNKIFAEAANGPHLLFTLVAGAVETISIALQNFCLACIMHGGEYLIAAQRSIDDVVGERLPTFDDRAKLPLVEALIREVLRYRPPVPVVAHLSEQDDVVAYRGGEYFIPGGTLLITSTPAIEHNPKHYTDPGSFNPRRFLDEQDQLRSGYRTSVFSFGRRVCPGIPLADRTLWLNAVTLLWLFRIRPVPGFVYRDDPGAYSGDVTNRLHQFPVIFEPRTATHASIVQQTYKSRPKNPFKLF